MGPHNLYIDRFVLPKPMATYFKIQYRNPCILWFVAISQHVWPTFGRNYINQTERLIFGETGHRECTLA